MFALLPPVVAAAMNEPAVLESPFMAKVFFITFSLLGSVLSTVSYVPINPPRFVTPVSLVTFVVMADVVFPETVTVAEIVLVFLSAPNKPPTSLPPVTVILLNRY